MYIHTYTYIERDMSTYSITQGGPHGRAAQRRTHGAELGAAAARVTVDFRIFIVLFWAETLAH